MYSLYSNERHLCDELVGLVSKKLGRALRIKEEAVDFFNIRTLDLNATVRCSNNFGGSEQLNRETERCAFS